MVKSLNYLFKNKNLSHAQTEDFDDWEQINKLIWMKVFNDNSIFSTPKLEHNNEKRLRVTNFPFHYKEDDLKELFRKYGAIKDVEIIRNSRGLTGFGFVTFLNGSDADKAIQGLKGYTFKCLHDDKVMVLELKVTVCNDKKSKANNVSSVSNESDDSESTNSDDICYKDFKNKLLKPLKKTSVLNDSMHTDSLLSSPNRNSNSRVNSTFSTPKKERKIHNNEKRLHVTNIPFDYTEEHLKQLFNKYGAIKDAEIIRNKRGSMGFGFLTFLNASDADKAIEGLKGHTFKRLRNNKIMVLELKINVAYEKRSRNNTHNEAANVTYSPAFENNNSGNTDMDSTNENLHEI